MRDLSKHLESKKIKEILDSVTALYNEKVKEEKEKEKGGKSAAGKGKAQLKAGKQTVNQQLVSDLMGEDEYDEEDDGQGTYLEYKEKAQRLKRVTRNDVNEMILIKSSHLRK